MLRYLALILAPLALAGCYREIFFLETGVFLGEHVGFVELYDGTVLGLHVETQQETLEAQRFTFSGTATLDGSEYRVEGEEWTHDTRITYQLAPPPFGYVEANFYREGAEPVYAISANVSYGCPFEDPCNPIIHGTLRQGEEPVGSVHLVAAE